MGRSMLAIDSLLKTYPGRGGRAATKALDGVSFTVKEGDFFTLLGPSGCGKTTTLQCIAGLEAPDDGTIRMGSEVVFGSRGGAFVPANRRGLGMVFQSYAIWPHMSVFDNVAFPLVFGGVRMAAASVKAEVMRALEMVQLGHLADRPAPMLSGGQQQRVALARALVRRPRILLLDEPLSNLDAKLRDTMRAEIRALVKSVGITTIFVTHDQTEAIGMSDQIVLMRAGRIVQQGGPRDIYLRPNSVFTADFMGRSNLIAGKAVVEPGAPLRIDTKLGVLVAETDTEFAPGASVVAVVRPQAVRIMPKASGSNSINSFAAWIVSLNFLGDLVEAEVEAGGVRMVLMLNPYDTYEEGSEITLHIPPENCVAVPADDREAAS
ncbi:ABC transporter ATP-binding protein [Chelativorans sp. Marseille-P2723]|uniref:ABC transporter ATP-binding protein n=1 Tax=Chelativorans sp. Marseille-P2723 TaxID=2709133 RepID=UPI0015714540|nr:ABC transporter ATP-binding protein [Chelativorans sp. Marseille-P2723]